MSQDTESTLIDKISFLTPEQQEQVLNFVEDIEAKEPTHNMAIIIRFNPYWIDIVASHPDRSLNISSRGGGSEIVDILADYFKAQHHLLVARSSAEHAFHAIGSLIPLMPERTVKVVGRNLDTGLPTSIEVSSIELRNQVSDEMQFKIRNVAGSIKLLPKNMQLPEDVLSGATIRIRGRYAHLNGLAEAVQEATGIKVIV